MNWDYVRVLPNGETVSVDGTHLGHNLPDSKGNRVSTSIHKFRSFDTILQDWKS